MKILCICEWGENRSVTIAHHLKFMGHETIAIGVKATKPDTRRMLYRWADRIIVADEYIEAWVRADEQAHPDDKAKVQLWDVGPDKFPRPMNRQLVGIVRKLVDEHRDEYEYARVGPYWRR